jgi:hypothetical protein
MTRMIPVIEQTMMVSIKVPVVDTSPWCAGTWVLAAAAAMGVEPIPTSVEKTPRATP